MVQVCHCYIVQLVCPSNLLQSNFFLFCTKERNPKVVVRTCNGVEIRDSYGETRMSRDLGGAYR